MGERRNLPEWAIPLELEKREILGALKLMDEMKVGESMEDEILNGSLGVV